MHVSPEWEALIRVAKGVINHWNEFGPEYDFAELMDHLEKAITRVEYPVTVEKE
jgi:hypothetical protein